MATDGDNKSGCATQQELLAELCSLLPALERAAAVIRTLKWGGISAVECGCGREGGVREGGRVPEPDEGLVAALEVGGASWCDKGEVALRLGERERRERILEDYGRHKEEFSERQWAALRLFYGEGKRRGDVAAELGIHPSAVYGLLRRAKTRKGECERRQRDEVVRLQKQLLRDCE